MTETQCFSLKLCRSQVSFGHEKTQWLLQIKIRAELSYQCLGLGWVWVEICSATRTLVHIEWALGIYFSINCDFNLNFSFASECASSWYFLKGICLQCIITQKKCNSKNKNYSVGRSQKLHVHCSNKALPLKEPVTSNVGRFLSMVWSCETSGAVL